MKQLFFAESSYPGYAPWCSGRQDSTVSASLGHPCCFCFCCCASRGQIQPPWSLLMDVVKVLHIAGRVVR